jgi:hypothetical protein
MRWAGLVDFMKEIKNAQKILIGKNERMSRHN